MEQAGQVSIFDDGLEEEHGSGATPARAWDRDSAKRALDDLFTNTLYYKSSRRYDELLKYMAHFPAYSPYNAMLLHVQMPGASYVAPPHRWIHKFGRRIKAGARPLVILQPMGPVMFVFDVSDTEPTEHARPLPPEVEKPFEVRRGFVGEKLEWVSENAKRYGVRVNNVPEGSQSAGSIGPIAEDVKAKQIFKAGRDRQRKPVFIIVPVRYDLVVNKNMSREARYATIVHELAHLYCGHLGTPNNKWWPDRRGLEEKTREFEAESVTYLVSSRFGIENPSAKYLADYLGEQEKIPPISLECVLKSAGLIEKMSLGQMKPRKDTR